jgi:hypothetical protein
VIEYTSAIVLHSRTHPPEKILTHKKHLSSVLAYLSRHIRCLCMMELREKEEKKRKRMGKEKR